MGIAADLQPNDPLARLGVDQHSRTLKTDQVSFFANECFLRPARYRGDVPRAHRARSACIARSSYSQASQPSS